MYWSLWKQLSALNESRLCHGLEITNTLNVQPPETTTKQGLWLLDTYLVDSLTFHELYGSHQMHTSFL